MGLLHIQRRYFYTAFLDFVRKTEDRFARRMSDSSSYSPESVANNYMEYLLKRIQRIYTLRGDANSVLRPTSLKKDPCDDPNIFYEEQRAHQAEQRDNNNDNAANEEN